MPASFGISDRTGEMLRTRLRPSLPGADPQAAAAQHSHHLVPAA
jgi:hypothetical protein